MRKFRIIIMLLFALGATAANAQVTYQDTVCAGATAQKYWVTKTAGSTYTWSITGGGSIASGQTTDTIVINWNATLGTDTLKVIETSADGCLGDPVALAVTRVGAPVADAGSDATIGGCGQSTTLDASGSTGAGTLSYAWAPAATLSATNITNPQASPLATTTYTVTVTSSFGCSSTDDVVVNVDNTPVAVTGANDTIGECLGQNTSLDGSSSTGTGIAYAWSPAASLNNAGIATPVANPIATTTYTLTVTDTYGCTSTATQVVVVENAPVAITAANDTMGTCVGQSANLDASSSTGFGLTYAWSPAATLANANTATPTATPASNTTFTVTVTDRHGCTATATQAVVVEAAPTADAGSNDTICNGGSTNLSATASTGSDLTYSWSASVGSVVNSTSATPSVSPTTTTTYTLTVTDKHGCTATSTVVVKVYDAPTADAGAYAPYCEGEVVNLSGTANNYSSLVWSAPSGDGSFGSNGTLTPTYTPGANDISNGTVSITLTAHGDGPCAADSDVTVITINPKPTTSPIHHF